MLRSEGKQPSLTVRCASPQGASHEGRGGHPRRFNLSSPRPPSPHVPALRHGRSPPRVAPRAVPARGWGHRTEPTATQGGEEGRAGGHGRGPLVAAPKPPKGAGVTADPSHPGHCRSPCDAQGQGPEGNPSPESRRRLPAARGDTHVPNAPLGPSWWGCFPAASPRLHGSPMAMPEEGEGWVSGLLLIANRSLR